MHGAGWAKRFAVRGNATKLGAATSGPSNSAPRSADAHYGLGLTLRHEGQLSAAVDCFLRAVCLRPDFFDAHVNLANAYEDSGTSPRRRRPSLERCG